MKADDLPEESNESIVVECELDEPREKVWRALTVPEIVAEWLNVEDTATPSREKCERPANQPLDPARLEYEVIAAEPPSQLQYRLREGDGLSVESTVTFELSDTPTGGTRLRIVHDAFEQTATQPEMPLLRIYNTRSRTRRALNRRRTRTLCVLRTSFRAAA
jgi:uncharacterized protein YndB with AHSA1/START domain